MQTLILCQQIETVFKDYQLESFFQIADSAFFVDSYEKIYAKGGRLRTQGLWEQQPLATAVELYPSFVMFADTARGLRELPAYQTVNKVLLSGHPYCQQILFNDDNLQAFLQLLCSARAEQAASQTALAQAFVHIASLQQRSIFVYGIRIDGKIEPENLYPLAQISNHLQYLFSQVYAAMLAQLAYDENTEIDKSILLAVDFSVDMRVDLQLDIHNIDIIDATNHWHYPHLTSVLPQLFADLLFLKQEKNAALGSNNKNYIRVCRELGLSCEPITRNKYLIRRGKRKVVYIPYHRTLQSKAAIERASSKAATSTLLKENGFQVNRNMSFHISELDEAQIDKIFARMKPPFVLKPTDQSAGYGVYLNVHNKELMLRVVDELKALDKINDIVVEEQFDGVMYRFVVINDVVAAVLRSNYPVLYGNGKDTLKQLIETYNLLNRRKIRINDTMKMYFDSLGLSLADIPARGQKIIASLKKIGDVTFNVTDIIDPRYKQLAVDVNRLSGLVVNGVDMMIASDGDYRIIELNPVPALFQHLAPDYGTSLDVFKEVVLYLLDHASDDVFDCHMMHKYHQ